MGLSSPDYAGIVRLSFRSRLERQAETYHPASRYQAGEWLVLSPLCCRVETDVRRHLVFLDKDNNLKLGDFGLSKAMAQAAMTNTYVGVSHSYSRHRFEPTDFVPDAVLHVARIDQRTTLRHQERCLGTRMSHLRTMCRAVRLLSLF